MPQDIASYKIESLADLKATVDRLVEEAEAHGEIADTVYITASLHLYAQTLTDGSKVLNLNIYQER